MERREASNTWRNSGWLREPWQNRAARHAAVDKRALFRNCLMMPGLPLQVQREVERAAALAREAPRARWVQPIPPAAARPREEPAARGRPERVAQPKPLSPQPAGPLARDTVDGGSVQLGALLFGLPPVGLVALWSSPAMPRDGKIALTAMTGLWLCLIAAVAIAAIVA